MLSGDDLCRTRLRETSKREPTATILIGMRTTVAALLLVVAVTQTGCGESSKQRSEKAKSK